MSALAHFNEAAQTYPLPYIAARLGLHSNTVLRWQERGEVPRHYSADLCRLLGKRENPLYKTAKAKDQFYTKPETVASCWRVFGDVARGLGVDLAAYHFIEPSAGCGGFYDILPPRRRTGIDIDPTAAGIAKHDYLTWSPEKNRRYAVIGNPPFGLRGHLALQFINHSAAFADLVGFILPQLFDSDGKGAPAKRVKGYKLAHSGKIPPDSFATPDGKGIVIHTLFQVWSKINTGRIPAKPPQTCKRFIRVLSISDGGAPSSTRNKAMIGKCDIYLPSTCFGGMRAYQSFEELPHRRGYGVVIHKNKDEIKRLMLAHDWRRTAFRSTNSALNLRSSIITGVAIAAGYCDE